MPFYMLMTIAVLAGDPGSPKSFCPMVDKFVQAQKETRAKPDLTIRWEQQQSNAALILQPRFYFYGIIV